MHNAKKIYLSLLFMTNVMYKTKIAVLKVQEIEQDIFSTFKPRCYAPNSRFYAVYTRP